MNQPTLNQSQNKKESTTLYKYRSWNNNFHKEILVDNKLYIPSLGELNDPFDFQLKLDFSLLDNDTKVDSFVNDMALDYNKNVTVTQEMLPKLGDVKGNYKFSIKNNPAEFAEKYHTHRLRYYAKHYGILCLSKNWNNILMWAHYGENHSGFCIGFNKKKIVESNYFGQAARVDYKEDYPLIDPIKVKEFDFETIFKQSNIKSIDWKYEEEFRFLKLWYPDVPSQKERLISFDNSIVDEIIIGLNISVDNEIEIREICKQKNIPVFKIKKSDYKFTLERE